SAPRRPPREARVATAAAAAGRARSGSTLLQVPASTPEAAAAEQALRAWRLERSRADKVPAYVVAPDKVLRAIAARRPSTLVELSRIDGIGPTKLELYGDDILAVLDSLS